MIKKDRIHVKSKIREVPGIMDVCMNNVCLIFLMLTNCCRSYETQYFFAISYALLTHLHSTLWSFGHSECNSVKSYTCISLRDNHG